MAYSPEKYQANKAAILAAKKRYYQKNREKILARQKAYDDEHRDEIKERHKKYSDCSNIPSNSSFSNDKSPNSYTMLSSELEALKRLNIPVKRWGDSFRVKVRNQSGRQVYIGSFSKSSNRKLLAKTYKLPEARVERNLNKNYKQPPAYSFTKSNVRETHLYEYYSKGEIFDKVRSTLKSQKKAFKVQVQLGYKLIDRVSGLERNYWPASNTEVFKKPIAINSKDDIEGKVMDEFQSQDFASKISYPSSSYQLKEITMAKVNIIYRDHTLGKNIPIPEPIKKNRFIVDFPNTNNKCMFYCIAYHFEEQTQDLKKRMVSLVKTRVKQYCEYKCIEYSAKFFKDMEPIDILAFDELEDCFQLRINVYEMDQSSLEVGLIRESKKDYPNRINILDYKSHAMYITNLDTVLSKSIDQLKTRSVSY
ncbi:unnamed protein product [Phytophthora lilii]|uniref:Unnamed protein product n=1 Tax=Phytophthora lilii TaxID=2077276 RepID=A0A9W6YKL2_9STRA|nr:unnamed protein product [Phytophthora lilii]